MENWEEITTIEFMNCKILNTFRITMSKFCQGKIRTTNRNANVCKTYPFIRIKYFFEEFLTIC